MSDKVLSDMGLSDMENVVGSGKRSPTEKTVGKAAMYGSPWRKVLACITLVLFVSAAAFGQEEGEEGAPLGGNQNKDQDMAEQLLRLKRWPAAALLYEQLYKQDEQNMVFALNLARCYYETGKLKESSEIFKGVLENDPNNLVALIQTARALSSFAAREGDQNAKLRLLNDARQSLVRAARYGANCLHDINTYAELRDQFSSDVDLQLKLIKAPQSPRPLKRARDPFKNPLPKKHETKTVDESSHLPPEQRITPEQQKALIQRLRGLIREIDQLIDGKDFDGIARVWLEVEDILRKHQSVTVLELQAELQGLQQAADDKKQVVKSLLLRAFYAQGEGLVMDMQASVDDGDYLRTFNLFSQLNQHARRMIETEVDFTKAANDLLARGQEYNSRAKILEEIANFDFTISGIVSGAGVAKAIVNNRVLTEDDVVYGPDGVPNPSLRVVTIKRRRVRFRYLDTEFERPLSER
ncbi:tetratricopeptide repeat protein [Planctomycetota bacterium]